MVGRYVRYRRVQCRGCAGGSIGRNGPARRAYLWYVHGDVRRPGAGRALPPAAEVALLGGPRLAGRGGYALCAGGETAWKSNFTRTRRHRRDCCFPQEALSGASAYAFLHFAGAGAPLAIALGCATTVGVRTYGYARNVKLPTYSDVPAGPAPRLAANDAHLVVTAWGPDATGHVAALARVLALSLIHI